MFPDSHESQLKLQLCNSKLSTQGHRPSAPQADLSECGIYERTNKRDRPAATTPGVKYHPSPPPAKPKTAKAGSYKGRMPKSLKITRRKAVIRASVTRAVTPGVSGMFCVVVSVEAELTTV
jgi:hypothetical protein